MAKTKTASEPKARKPRTATTNQPTHEQIALRAYHIYLERKGAPGNPFEDWKRAERELTELVQKPAAKPRKRKATVTSIAA
jgi:Protein of unknown function (DUF2934)